VLSNQIHTEKQSNRKSIEVHKNQHNKPSRQGLPSLFSVAGHFHMRNLLRATNAFVT